MSFAPLPTSFDLDLLDRVPCSHCRNREPAWERRRRQNVKTDRKRGGTKEQR